VDLRTQMFRRLLSLPVSWFDNHTSGNIISRYTFNVQRVMQAATEVIVTLVRDSLTVAGLLAWSFYISWRLSLVVLLIAPLTVSATLPGWCRKASTATGRSASSAAPTTKAAAFAASTT
jgi:subfamily B ATP-binding cassette protein MsbA